MIPESICFSDQRRGWCALGDPTADRHLSARHVFETEDGGLSWKKVLETRFWPEEIAIEHERLYAFGNPLSIWSRSQAEHLCADWVALMDEPNEHRDGISVAFGDHNFGIAVNIASEILATTDGGRSWIPATQNIELETPLQSIDFSTARAGFALASDYIYRFQI